MKHTICNAKKQPTTHHITNTGGITFMRRMNRWTHALAAAGLVSLTPALQAEESGNAVLTQLSQTTLSGYVSTSAIWVPGRNDTQLRLPGRTYTGPDKADGFNLDVVSLSLEKPLQGTGTWEAGYNVQLLFGPDATGFNTSINAGDHESDFAVKRANVVLRAPVGNGLDFTMGVFDTVVGYEVWDNPYNPNFSRSYGYALEPTQHTGILASYEFNQIVSANFGVANTTHPRINARAMESDRIPAEIDEDQKTIMGSMTLTAPDSMGSVAGSSLTFGAVYGQDEVRGHNLATLYYVGGNILTPIEGLSFGAAWDLRDMGENNAADAWTLAGYGSYQATEKFSVHARVEYAQSNGASYGDPVWGAGEIAQVEHANDYYEDGLTATAAANNDDLLDQELLGATLTAQYDLFQNVLARGEVRYDVDLEDDNGGVFGTTGHPQDDSWWLALNIVYLF